MSSLMEAETFFIFACGPSVNQWHDWDVLKNKGIALAVNESFRLPYKFDAAVSMDGRWMHHNIDKLLNAGLPLYASRAHYRKWCQWVYGGLATELNVNVEAPGLSESFQKMHAKNSGFLALQLAYLFKPKNIFLFGFDNMVIDGFEHWHGQYPWRPERKNYCHADGWLEDHNIASQQFKDACITVYNVSPQSAITAYQRIDHDTAKAYIQRLPTIK